MRKSGWYKVVLWGFERVCFYSSETKKWRFACNEYIDIEFDSISDETVRIDRKYIFI